jgi:trans-aconitate 2-methyltransferase
MGLPTLKQTWDPELYEARHAFVWHFGESLVELLAPASGERILDLGCGPGQLTSKIAEHGATVIGVDSSPEMIGQARQNFPKLHFVLQSGTAMEFEDEFDAIFSNATLHWILDARAVAGGMFRALRKGGRLVAEFGGIGNVKTIESAISDVLARYTASPVPGRRYYPSVGQYASLLEEAGFEVRFAHLFERPTVLEGENGMQDWIVQFSGFQFDPLAPSDRKQALKETVEILRPKLYRDEQWFADYRRLRIIAAKL